MKATASAVLTVASTHSLNIPSKGRPFMMRGRVL
jgi:hypothetical protein